jgi:hypothetical protein
MSKKQPSSLGAVVANEFVSQVTWTLSPQFPFLAQHFIFVRSQLFGDHNILVISSLKLSSMSENF